MVDSIKASVGDIFADLCGAEDRLPSVSGPPLQALTDIGLTVQDFEELLLRAKLNEQLSTATRAKWQRALGLVEPPKLPDHPDDWVFPCTEEGDAEESTYVFEKGGADLDFKAMPYALQISHLSNPASSQSIDRLPEVWVVPSGGGKSYWAVKHPDVFRDVESELPAAEKILLKELRHSDQWAKHDNEYDHWLSTLSYDNRVVLVHTPRQAAVIRSKLGEVRQRTHPDWASRARKQRFDWMNTQAQEFIDIPASSEERLWQTCYPFRVRGECGLRRLRLSDLPLLYNNPSRLEAVLAKLEGCRSYIFVLNMCMAELINPHFSYIDWYHSRGGLVNIAVFLAFAKKVTITLKAVVYPDRYLMLVENTGMSGYRLLPDPNFDIVTATEASASGLGLPHVTHDGLAEPWGWWSCLSSLKVSPAHTFTHGEGVKTFEQFIDEVGLWSTSGSSSFGRLTYITPDGKPNSVKARKLMLPFITDASKLVEIAKAVSTTHATSLVKSELAKIRIAVASELGFYLVWSYLHYVYGDIYMQWPGVTLGETTRQELERLYEMYITCDGTWGFPADFQQFDAQPLTSEIVAIGASLLRSAGCVTDLPAWLKLCSLFGLASSVLSTPKQDNGVIKSFKVTNYLPSGIAITSAVGNGFNCLASRSMILLVSAWAKSHEREWLKHLSLRGDDSSFMVTHISYCFLLSLSAKMMNYKHAPFKVALLREGTELLRVSISKEHGCRGYPARLVPTLTQRKPWSNEPWDAEGVVRSHWDTCSTLVRRRMPGLQVWSRLRLVWLKKRNLPAGCLSASSLDGGLGIGPPNDVFNHVTPSMSFVPRPAAKVKTSGWAERYKILQFKKAGVTVPYEVAAAIVQDQAIATLSTVDLPDAAKNNQAAYKRKLTSIRCIPRPIHGISPGFQNALGVMQQRLLAIETPDQLKAMELAHRPVWLGKYYEERTKVSLNRELSNYSDIKLSYTLDFSNAVGSFMRRMRCRRSVAEDWLTGIGPPLVMGWVHPNLQAVASKITIHAIEQSTSFAEIYKLGLGVVCRLVAWELGSALASSPLHYNLYSW